MHPSPAHEWQELTRLTQGAPLVVERVRLADSGVAIEGAFALPQLAQLAAEDQVFIAAFVHAHGSIKEMERVFGISYPTVKSRLDRISKALTFVDSAPEAPPAPQTAVLERLQRGEISTDEAVRALESLR